MHLEREAKLTAPSGFELPDLDGMLAGTAAAPTREQLDAVYYYDTAELQLARFGVTLRHRTGESPGWTLKLPDGAGGPGLVRREFTFDGPPDQVPAGASDLMRAYVRGLPLAPVAQLCTNRTLVAVRDAQDEAVADVVDDAVVVYEGTQVASEFRESKSRSTSAVAAAPRCSTPWSPGSSTPAAETTSRAPKRSVPSARAPRRRRTSSSKRSGARPRSVN
jgi:inorganic triphosphatase YgiF